VQGGKHTVFGSVIGREKGRLTKVKKPREKRRGGGGSRGATGAIRDKLWRGLFRECNRKAKKGRKPVGEKLRRWQLSRVLEGNRREGGPGQDILKGTRAERLS